MKTYTDKAFRQSAIALGGLALLVFLAFFRLAGTYGEILGLLVFFSGFFAIFGSVNSLKSLKEPNSTPKILAMVVNFTIAILFGLILALNVWDMIKAFA